MKSFLRAHIEKRADEWECEMPHNWKKIIKKYKKSLKTKRKFIFITYLTEQSPEVINACSTPLGPIFVNAEWAARIVLCDNADTLNAFQITIGHEVTHQNNEMPKLVYGLKKGVQHAKKQGLKYITKHGIKESIEYGKKYISIISYVNEVRADFGGAAIEKEFDRNDLLDSIKYKKGLKDVDKNTFLHPSWERRKFYATHFDFGKRLIQRIIEDEKFDDTETINKILAFYNNREIKLIPEPLPIKDEDDAN